jgi:hypothetical protein
VIFTEVRYPVAQELDGLQDRGIDLEELRATMFAGYEVDGYRLEVYP